MKLYIIRHGETEASPKGLLLGRTDMPLSSIGKEKILSLVRSGIYPDKSLFSIFATSELQRTYDTLQLIYDNINAVKLPELNEYDFGDFELKSPLSLNNDRDFILWSENPYKYYPPNGENAKAFTNRITKALMILKHLSDNGNVFLVWHGVAMDSLYSMLFHTPNMSHFPQCGHGFIIDIDIDNDSIVNAKFIGSI